MEERPWRCATAFETLDNAPGLERLMASGLWQGKESRLPPAMTRARALLVTALDTGLIVAASAAIVVLLGRRTRVDFGVAR